MNDKSIEVEVGNGGSGGPANGLTRDNPTLSWVTSQETVQAAFDAEQQVFIAGYYAGKAGLASFENPYTSEKNPYSSARDREFHVLWYNGWKAGREEPIAKAKEKAKTLVEEIKEGLIKASNTDINSNIETVSDYQLRMDVPIENLAAELFGVSGNGKKLEDHEIVEHAIRKIRMLKKMLIATGLKENLLQVMMEE